MSHFCVMVIGKNIEGQLAPYSENSEEFKEFHPCTKTHLETFKKRYPEKHSEYLADYEKSTKEIPFLAFWAKDWHGSVYNKNNDQWGNFFNKNGKWETYEVGGKYSSYFKKNNGHNTSSLTIKEWDIETQRNAVRVKANKFYTNLEKVLGGRKIPNWQEYTQKYTYMNEARERFYTHPVIRDLRRADIFEWETDLEQYNLSREDYLQYEIQKVGVPTIVVKNGVWYEIGENNLEQETQDWDKQFWNTINSLPTDTMITVVDCYFQLK